MNYIICDDQQSWINTITTNLNKVIEKNNLPGSIVLDTQNPSDVIKYAKECEIDAYEINVYLLDVDLNANKNGLELARQVRMLDPLAYIIFITAHLEYGMLVFKYKLKAFEYLVKPVDYVDFSRCIVALTEDYNKFLRTIENDKQTFVNIVSGYKEYKLNINDILYIESKGPKVIIHTINNAIETYMSLNTIEDMLNVTKALFYRTHKTFLINLMHVEHINFSQMFVRMINGDICMISRNKKADLKAALNTTGVTLYSRE